jgi:tetratricopeptide (TPR) repeat protein
MRLVVAGLLVAAACAGVVPTARAQGEGGDRGTLARLEQRSKAFYDLLERGEREKAAATAPALLADLTAFTENIQKRLDGMRDEVMERDGDIEELYRSPRWREPEIASLVATYHLAWVRYQAAQLTGDPAKKKKLLEQAAEGFSQFLVVNEVPEIYGESLYGRGLAFLDLGERGKAIEDLQAAVEQPRVAAKARAALEEARRRSGAKGPEETGPDALLARLGELLPKAAGGDAPTEKEATTLARGLAVRGGPWPARVATLVAERLGGGQASGVRSTYGLFLLAQLAVDRGRCADVAPFAATSAEVQDAARARLRPEILFLQAGCQLNTGAARAAAAGFAALLREFPDSARAREAAYYRFRALDVARAEDAAMTPEYEQALQTYLSRYGSAEGAPEARFLLGDLYRSRGDCTHAQAEYDAVRSGPFALRAQLGTLECRVAGLPKGAAGAPQRAELVTALGDFARTSSDQALAARATLLAAAVAAGATPPDHATALKFVDGFEQRFPDAKALHAHALDLRLSARAGTGQLDGAAQDLDRFLQLHPEPAERRATLSRLGRDLATRAERGPEAERAATLALARKAYEALLADGGDPRDQVVLADLELRTGDAAAARRRYEQVLASDATSAEALRGAARAAAGAGDRDGALGYWRRVLDASPPGGTAWYEARLAQVDLLREDGRRAQACEILRGARGRATSAGGDQIEARLRSLEPEVCR